MKQYEKKFQMLCFEVILSIENKVYYAWDNFVFIYLQGVQQDSHYALFATLYAISVSRRVQFFTSCSKLGVTFFPFFFFFCVLCISLENCRCSCRPAFHIPSSTKHSHLTIDLFFFNTVWRQCFVWSYSSCVKNKFCIAHCTREFILSSTHCNDKLVA